MNYGPLPLRCTRPDYPGAIRRRVQIVAALWTLTAITVGVHGVFVLKAHDLMFLILEVCATAIALGLWFGSTRFSGADSIVVHINRETGN